MRARIQGTAALALLVLACHGHGQELLWRPAAGRTAPPAAAPSEASGPSVARAPIRLGQPEALRPVSYSPAPTDAPLYIPLAMTDDGPGAVPAAVVRAQVGEPVPPPPPPPPGSLLVPAGPGEEGYNCGVANTPHAGGGFWSKFCDKISGCWNDVTGSVKTGNSGARFQSDHKFDVFASPVSNPFYFEDPRSLTEVRPLFVWQHTPGANPNFAGGNNFFIGARGSLAFTDWLSVTVDEFGWAFIHPEGPLADLRTNNGFAEIHLGPKVTFIRNENTRTVAAAGLIFELPVGSARVFQHTHDLGLTPYFSIAQNFGCSQYGSFNFMNTDGYSIGVGEPRGDFFFASFHLDYDVGNLKKIYPLVELNWTAYTQNGNQLPINFEGRDLFHFGATNVSGLSDLTLALGARYKVSECLQFGLVGEFNVLGGGRHLDAFRMTFDVIFRY